MSFTANNYQQQSFIDAAAALSERDREALTQSWAGVFEREIFPRIDEQPFSVLFSEKSPSPNAPINVLVAAMILEELFGLSDDEIVDSASYDIRFQTALHTTSSVEQPFSARSLVRLRQRCRSYAEEHREPNLLRTCISEVAPQMDALITKFFPQRRLDTEEIISRILRSGTGRKFRYEIVKNPEIFKENVLPAHSEHEVRGDAYQRISLNGLWKFSYAVNYESSTHGFEKTAYSCRGWKEIRVPAHFQLEGYGRPAYVNVQYPWEGREEIRPGQIPERENPVGSYVKYFTLPKEWDGRPVYISFQGVESGFALWLNGCYVGYSEDSFTPSEFELTPFLSPGENKLAVQVFMWTASSWMEDQDFYRFAGIFRDVYLFTTPDIHLYDVSVRALPRLVGLPSDEAILGGLDQESEPAKDSEAPSLDEETSADGISGELHIAAKLRLPAALSQSFEVAWRLLVDPEREADVPAGTRRGPAFQQKKEEIASGLLKVANPEEIGTEDDFLVMKAAAKIPQVKLWSAEIPNLYELEISIYSVGEYGTRSLIETATERVGFRKFEMKDGIMCLNGKRIVFKGANRHDFSSDTGRAISEEEIRKDILTMKRNNINAIRTSHYPNTELLYRLCDEYGLYLIAENNMETHGSWDLIELGRGTKDLVVPGERPEFLSMCLDRINSCYQRDKNHPAILIWSVGNESYGGKDIWEMSQLFRRLDPDRLVHYEGIFHDRSYPDTSDMESQMYPSAASIRQFLKEHPEKPFICCEYTHSMGNSNGGMHLYTELTDEEPRYQGGFIWDFVDQALRVTPGAPYGNTASHRAAHDSGTEGVFIYGGDCGERPTDYEFSGNGIVNAEREPYEGKMQEVKFLYQNIEIRAEKDRALIRNKNLFRNTSDYDCVVTLEKEGELLASALLLTNIEPLSERMYLLPLPVQTKPGEYVITVSFRLKKDTIWAPAGHEMAYGQYVYRVLQEQGEEIIPGDLPGAAVTGNAAAGGAIEGTASTGMKVIHSQHNIGVRGEHFEVLFSLLKGGLVSYRYGGAEMIDAIPRLNFWRAPTNNDDGSRMAARHGQWKLASLYQGYLPEDFTVLTPEEMMEAASWPRIKERRDRIDITWKYYLPTSPRSSATVTYRVTADGAVRFLLDYAPVEGLPPMPEFGMLLQLPAEYQRITWYGNGPAETYCDRDKGAKLGVYQSTTAAEVTQYLVPQECGNKTGVRWARVTDTRGRGMEFRAGSEELSAQDDADADMLVMEFSALPYTPEELENAKHHYELPVSYHTVIRCSLMRMGVGGDDSWGARTLPQYELPGNAPLHFEFEMRGI